jgi:probable rRNA maturation factor
MPKNVRIYFPGVSKMKISKAVNSLLPRNKTITDFGLIFVSSRRMSELNKKYRGKRGPTNVLSFDTGDVVICPSIVKKQAEKFGFTQKKWMTRLVVHGILHLAGYDHKVEKDKKKMENLEDKILKKLGV